MGTSRKSFDAVDIMRRTRDRLGRRFKGLTFAEQKLEMERLAKGRPPAHAAPKRRTA